MIPKIKTISEEIVRWGFEVQVDRSPDWEVAFTNPTAGPWKRIMGVDNRGISGEVHRFEIEEKRPDLVLYSDRFKTVIIIEAKTDLQGLGDKVQLPKTSELFKRLSGVLQSKKLNKYWAQRAEYKYELGLLWGKKSETEEQINKIAFKYVSLNSQLIEDIVCIQGDFVDEVLVHRIWWGNSKKKISLNRYQS